MGGLVSIVSYSVLNVKALVGAFNQEKALLGAFSVIVQPVVEPMDRFAAHLSSLISYYTCDMTNEASFMLHLRITWSRVG